MQNISLEDYLSVIYKYRDANQEIKPNIIAEKLHVSRAAVTDMLRRLNNQDYISYVPYKSVSLTASGETYARTMVRRHRIWEVFLSEIVGMPWHSVHEEAERLEHSSSDELIDRLEEMCHFPDFDPHGAPIPKKDGGLPQEGDLLPLSALSENQEGIVKRVDDFDKKLLKYFFDIGLQIDQKIRVQDIFDVDRSLLILVGANQVNISSTLADNVFVQPMFKQFEK